MKNEHATYAHRGTRGGIRTALVFLIACASLFSYEIRLRYIGYAVEDEDLYVVVDMKQSFPDEVVSYIQEGVVVSVNYHVEFYETRWLFDRLVSRIRYHRIIYFDFWTRSYVIEDSAGDVMYTTDDITNAIHMLYADDRIAIAKLEEILPKKRYYFKTRLTMQFVDVYPTFNIFFNLLVALRYKIKWLKSPVTLNGEDLIAKGNVK